MVRRLIAVFSFLLFMVLTLGSPVASAQVLYGSIVGTVTDQSGAVIPKADVKAVNPQTGETREVTTDAAGRFTIGNVLPGVYEIHVTATGFSAVTTTGVTATINTVTRVDVQMQVGSQAQNVTVTGAAMALQTDKSDTHTELQSARVGKSTAAQLSELSKSLQPSARRDARGIYELHYRYSATPAQHKRERHQSK